MILVLLVLSILLTGCIDRIISKPVKKQLKLSFNPEGGTYSGHQYVVIECNTDGASIYYTTDGSEPSKSAIRYSEPIEISTTTTLKSKAYKKGWKDSASISANYEIELLQVGAPIFNPEPGEHYNILNVSISCNTDGAEIYYTVDGSEPTKASNYYTYPVPITNDILLKAKAFKKSWLDSETAEGEYNFVVAEPTFTPAAGIYNKVQVVSIECITELSTIYYTLDGSEPNEESEQYTKPIEINEDTVVKAKAFHKEWPSSKTGVANYEISFDRLAAPQFSPGEGEYSEVQQVEITCSTEGVSIHYTVDGTEPTEESLRYFEPIEVDSNTVIKAKAFKAGWKESVTASAEYTFYVSTPIFDPPQGDYEYLDAVSILCETIDVKIYYTTDGTMPDDTSKHYLEPIPAHPSLNLKAVAYKSGWKNSEVASGKYKVKYERVHRPRFDPIGGLYFDSQTVTISSSTPGATIHYTTNGESPSEKSPVYTKPVLIDEKIVLKAIAVKEGIKSSDVTKGTYTLQVTDPVLSAKTGAYDTPILLSITGENESASYLYTTDQSEPTESSTVYTGPFLIESDTRIKVKGMIPGWKSSYVVSEVYLIDEFVFVKGGTFRMGSNTGSEVEMPMHNVEVSNFYMAKATVTINQWKDLMEYVPWWPSNERNMNLPIFGLTWYEAIDYCNKRSIKENLTPAYSINGDTNPDDWEDGIVECNWLVNGYRLPTEAEWEYAAGGGINQSGYRYSGSDVLDEVGWYKDNSGSQLPVLHEIAEKKPNALGIYDMSGNVWEWCWDIYDKEYYKYSPSKNPKGAETGDEAVLRGGAYHNAAPTCGITKRASSKKDKTNYSLGLRLVRTIR